MIKAGIVGGAGYTGGELIRLLNLHPSVNLCFVQSRSQAGKFLSDTHADLFGETNLKFSSDISTDIDVLFLCTGHGEAEVFLKSNTIPESIKIIDLSQDFRLASPAERKFIYGLPELYRPQIKNASNIANPGCFATAIQLAHLPLTTKKLLKKSVHITAVTGSTGAGQGLSATSHFSWRHSNISLYKAFNHQHLNEIRMVISQLQKGELPEIRLLPFRGSFTRGILAVCYTQLDLSLEQAKDLYCNYYAEHPFVSVSNKNPDVKQVVNSNKAILYLEKHENELLIVSVIDNLLKGASGQAVQNMNLMFGLDEVSGLQLKASAF